MAHLINLQLEQTPHFLWDQTVKDLSKQYNVPLAVQQISQSGLSKQSKQQLKTFQMTYAPPLKDDFIREWYYQTPNPNLIIKVGPITYPWWVINNVFMQDAYLLFFAIIMVVILTFLFTRNVRKIHGITKQYSQGHFEYKESVGWLSTLHGTYRHILCMGDQLKRLIKSQQNMTRFFAHETRTPLTTIQLALSRLNEGKRLSDSDITHLNNIQEDINDLEMLVTQLLVYSRTMSNDLKISLEEVNLRVLLENIINPFQASNITIQFDASKVENIFIQCDPRLIKHAISNLISNALKFSNNTIIVSVEQLHNYIYLHVDDDGPGIKDNEVNEIFNEFVTLETNASLSQHIGLGLMITKTIIEKHKGKLTIAHSPLLAGSRFTVTLESNFSA